MNCNWNILGWDHHPHLAHRWCCSIVPPGLSYRFLLTQHDKVEWKLQLNGCLDSTSKWSYYRSPHHRKQSVTKLFPQNNRIFQAEISPSQDIAQQFSKNSLPTWKDHPGIHFIKVSNFWKFIFITDFQDLFILRTGAFSFLSFLDKLALSSSHLENIDWKWQVEIFS